MSHATLTTDLVNWWQMDDDPDSGVIVDSNGKMALIPVLMERVNGQIDYALEFGGTNSMMYADSSDFTTMQGRSFSIMVWFRMDGENLLNLFQYLVSKFPVSPGPSGEYFLRYETAAFFHGAVGASASAVLAHEFGVPTFNAWHMIVMSYNRITNKVSLRLDNRNYAASQTTVDPVATTNDFILGNDSDGAMPFNGAFGPVGIWWKELTNGEVEALWNDGEWLTYDQLPVAECDGVECCNPETFSYQSNTATNADGDLDSEGPPNPNCPDGYVWGGLSCLREQSPQQCSDGYYWDGVACRIEGDSVVCAPGYFLEAGNCIPCTAPAAPVLTAAHLQITLNFNVADTLLYNIFRSNDGQNYTLLTSDIAGAAAESYVDSTTVAGVTYYYYISVWLSPECGFTDGAVASALAF